MKLYQRICRTKKLPESQSQEAHKTTILIYYRYPSLVGLHCQQRVQFRLRQELKQGY